MIRKVLLAVLVGLFFAVLVDDGGGINVWAGGVAAGLWFVLNAVPLVPVWSRRQSSPSRQDQGG